MLGFARCICVLSILFLSLEQKIKKMGDRPMGPLGIDPLHFSLSLGGLLLLFVLYLLLPKGLRVHYFLAYPKRYAWAARQRSRRSRNNGPVR